LAGFEVTLYGRFWVTPEDDLDALVREVGLKIAARFDATGTKFSSAAM
jgi:hypothetical protein